MVFDQTPQHLSFTSYPPGCWSHLPALSLAVIFVVAVEPVLALIALVAPFRSAIKDRVIPHQELCAAGVARVAVIHGVALARKRADAMSLGEIAFQIRPARGGVLDRELRRVLTEGRLVPQHSQEPKLVRLGQWCGWSAGHVLSGRHAEVEVEFGLVAGRPLEAPTHALTVGA